jgi:hypothetical protein
MAKFPKQVNTRKIALIRELGYDEKHVAQDGFDHEGFIVVKFGPDGKVLLHSNDEVVTERVLWPDLEWSRRAAQAMGDDFNETYAQRPQDRFSDDLSGQVGADGGGSISERHTGAEGASIGELSEENA